MRFLLPNGLASAFLRGRRVLFVNGQFIYQWVNMSSNYCILGYRGIPIASERFRYTNYSGPIRVFSHEVRIRDSKQLMVHRGFRPNLQRNNLVPIKRFRRPTKSNFCPMGVR